MQEFIDADGVVLTKEEYRQGLGKGRVRQVTGGFEESIVDESKRDDADLNVLVRRWMRGEAVPQFAPGAFADVSEVGGFQKMQERLLEVESAFRKLPLEVREHFRNSPALFADAFSDPAQLSMLEEMGVVVREGVEPPPEPPVEPAPVAPPLVQPPA